jgi:quinol monooxygenase YgiN
MLIVAGKGYLIDANLRDAFVASMQEATLRTRREPGCMDYVVAADPIETDRVNVFERWESAADLELHLTNTAVPEGIAAHVRSMEVLRYEVSAAGPVSQ